MFKKPFKQKSQISLRSTEKKKFLIELKTLFPSLTNEDIDFINGSKENLMKIKVTTIKEEIVEIYLFDKVPYLFDLVDSGIKLPTVFMCWRFPHIVPQITIDGVLLPKLQSGADLFSPGILLRGLSYDARDFQSNVPVYINLANNKAAVAVGLSLLSKQEILSSSEKHQPGKAVKLYHVAEDFLYKLHPEAKLPEMGFPEWAHAINNEPTPEDDKNIKNCINKIESNNGNSTEAEKENHENESITNEASEKNSEENEKQKANDILEYCFLKALKTVPKNSYPMLPATFYANHVLKSLPEGEVLNIKKTKWKKFSVFLQEKSLEGLIKLQPVQKGDFTISGVENGHKLIREFVDPFDRPIVVEPVSKSDKPSMLQVFSVSAVTVPFFSKFGLKKNDEMTRTDVKVHLNDYIKRENLIHPVNMEKVKLDPTLYEIIKGDEILSRAELLTKLLDKMSVRFKISTTPNVVHKGKMPVIDFEVFTRTGNKKVTVISNLESYGVNIAHFSKELQQKAAASTTIINSGGPDKKGPQVQVQGNQILIAVKILKEDFNISDKFMRGLDKAAKGKNKGK